jgi:hypothetical protein
VFADGNQYPKGFTITFCKRGECARELEKTCVYRETSKQCKIVNFFSPFRTSSKKGMTLAGFSIKYQQQFVFNKKSMVHYTIAAFDHVIVVDAACVVCQYKYPGIINLFE